MGSTQTKDGTSPKEVKIRLAQAHPAMTRLAVLWKTMENKTISLPIKIVSTNHSSMLLYGYERWTMTTDLERRI